MRKRYVAELQLSAFYSSYFLEIVEIVEKSFFKKRYVFILIFSDAGNSDRVVIQELLKTVAQSQQLETNTQRDFKGLYIHCASYFYKPVLLYVFLSRIVWRN